MLEMLNLSLRKDLYGKIILSNIKWLHLTQAFQFFALLRTYHQAMLTEIVKLLVETNIRPVPLMLSTGQLKIKSSCATTSTYSKGSAQTRMFFCRQFSEIAFSYLFRTSLHLAYFSWLFCTEHKLVFLQNEKKIQGKEKGNVFNKVCGSAERCILCWKTSLT